MVIEVEANAGSELAVSIADVVGDRDERLRKRKCEEGDEKTQHFDFQTFRVPIRSEVRPIGLVQAFATGQRAVLAQALAA